MFNTSKKGLYSVKHIIIDFWGYVVNFSIECERELDGRWLAEVSELPGVLAYGVSAEEAMAKAEVLALRVLAERLECYETRAFNINISIPQAA